jgi:hypothetical protein
MTIDEDNLKSAAIERIEETILELIDDDYFLRGVASAADVEDTGVNRAIVIKKIREAAEAVATM